MTQDINLQTASLQEIFTFVAEALLEQGKPSISENDACLYRAPDGCKCAAGWLLPDEKYSADMEGKSVDALRYFKQFEELKLALISALQRAHDEAAIHIRFIPTLTAELDIVAARFNLSGVALPASPTFPEISNG